MTSIRPPKIRSFVLGELQKQFAPAHIYHVRRGKLLTKRPERFYALAYGAVDLNQ